MHPPFYVVGPQVNPDPHPTAGRRTTRRNKPEALRLTPVMTAWPPVPLVAPQAAPAPNVIHLRLAAAPTTGLRTRIGRWLIRMGQRMVLQH